MTAIHGDPPNKDARQSDGDDPAFGRDAADPRGGGEDATSTGATEQRDPQVDEAGESASVRAR